MSQHYLSDDDARDEYTLPSVETFYRTTLDNASDGFTDEDGNVMGAGWYWWTCLPGCLPDSDPFGPFATEAEALADARDDEDEDEDEDDGE